MIMFLLLTSEKGGGGGGGGKSGENRWGSTLFGRGLTNANKCAIIRTRVRKAAPYESQG